MKQARHTQSLFNPTDRSPSHAFCAYDAKGELIARDVAHRHNGKHINKDTALDEKGNVIKGRGDTPNERDILTGSRADGTAFAPQTDATCKAWTSSTEGSAIVGHHDRIGPLPENWAKSWNFSHPSSSARAGANERQQCAAVGSLSAGGEPMEIQR